MLATTFLLTVLRDLTEAIVVGFALGSVLFIHRMSRATGIEARSPLVGEDVPDALAPGAAASIGSVLDRISDAHRALVVDFSAVPFLDSTGAHVVEGLSRKAARAGVRLFLAGADVEARRVLLAQGLRAPEVSYAATVEDALRQYRAARGDKPR